MNSETRMKVIIRDMFSCQRCGKQPSLAGLQIAHRILNGSTAIRNIKNQYPLMTNKYIQENIIDNEKNLVTVCSLKCNDSFCVMFNTVEMDKLLTKIINSLE